MSIIEAVLLGVVQGLTEFLPVSSSGHLVLAKSILGVVDDGIAFEIFVHFGTLVAVLTVYKKDIWHIFIDLKARFLPKHNPNNPNYENQNNGEQQGVRLLWLIIVGTIPAALLGMLFRDVFESAFSDTVFVCFALIVTGLILTLTRLAKETKQPLNLPKSFLVGLAQVMALFPGISRSGTTISAGLFLKVQPEESARYSFLLAVPLILGVTIVKSYELWLKPPPLNQISDYLVGCAAAYLSGLWAIRWLVIVVRKGRFNRFAYYCFFVGILGLVWHYVT